MGLGLHETSDAGRFPRNDGLPSAAYVYKSPLENHCAYGLSSRSSAGFERWGS